MPTYDRAVTSDTQLQWVGQCSHFSQSSQLTPAPIDGDGRADVFVVVGEKVHRYEATGQPGVLQFIPEALGGKVTSVAVGNLDHDAGGRGDLIVGRRLPKRKLGTIWWEPPHQGGNSLFMVTSRFGSSVQPNGIAIGTGPSGSSDLYLARGGSLTRYRCESDNAFKSSEHGIVSGVQCLATGDLDQNGMYDLLVGMASRLRWYQSEQGVLVKKHDFDGQDYKALAVGNLDGDGHPDVVAVVDCDEQGAMKWFEASGQGAATLTEIDLSLTHNSGFTSVAIGDIDGDGRGELLATQSAGPVRWFVSHSNNVLTELAVTAFGEGASGVAIASSDPAASWPERADDGGRPNVGDVEVVAVGDDAKRVRIVDRRVVATSEEDLNFPQFRVSQTGVYAIGYATGHHGATGWHWAVSTDQGKSWVARPGSELPGLLATLELGDGRTVSMGYRVRNTPDPRVKAATVKQSTENWDSVRTLASTVKFPFDMPGFVFVRSMIRAREGTKIYAVGHRAARGGGAMMLESKDLGLTWTYKSTIIAKSEEWMGRSGPSETALARLTNGNLLAVMRTGATSFPIADPPAKCPMAYAVSTDDGATWGEPMNMQCPGVFPDIAVLRDGTVVMLSGRPGVYVRLAAPDGMTWSEPLFLFQGAGCANSSMQLDADGTLVVVYTESDFCGHEFPGSTNYLKMVRLTVTD